MSLDRDLTIREDMEFRARLRHIDSSKRKQRIAKLLKYVDLTVYADKMVDTLSDGLKKKAIVCSLLHNPKILFLDEPTLGLDAQAQRCLTGY
ncbi:MAG TPA: ATP-binding cassette domain-containing protein [Candidatus Limnocylindrales bacterium]|nr:ATP-binding cassette domain-containing protein [Candidatus Limnocylindrales bacterium]